MCGVVHVAVTAKKLFAQQVLFDTVEVVDHRHAAPAHAKRGMHVGLGPVHNLCQLVPIRHIAEIKVFNWRTGDDQPVKFLILDLLEGAVEFFHVVGRCIARLVSGHADQRQFNLKRRRTDQAGKLVLCLNFFGHQIEDTNPHWADVLKITGSVAHHHHTLAREHIVGG